MHVGYEDRAERALRDRLGDDYLNRRVTRVSYRPWVDVPNALAHDAPAYAFPRKLALLAQLDTALALVWLGGEDGACVADAGWHYFEEGLDRCRCGRLSA
jgi:hypothetical protein